jgi:Ran GTPase-activating protein (RanGAP) involved in mRNA processing and transport
MCTYKYIGDGVRRLNKEEEDEDDEEDEDEDEDDEDDEDEDDEGEDAGDDPRNKLRRSAAQRRDH